MTLSPVRAEEDLRLQADEVTHDTDLNLYVARGNVEIQYKDRVVRADTVTYNEAMKTISASGNVVILLPSGDTLFATHADVTDTLDEGKLADFRALLSDQSRLWAKEARRHRNGQLNELDRATYTPCLPCKEHPERSPLWQLKAYNAVQDKDKGTITYHDAWMEIYGVPVFYTPYFQHADVGVKRQSGLLAPGGSYSKSSGLQIRQPYYATLGPDKDITFTPIFRVGGTPDSDPRGVGVLEYRQRVTDGRFRIEGSGTAEDRQGDYFAENIRHDDFRGHIEGDGEFDLDDHWRAGFNFKNTTDKRYLRRYHLGTATWLQDRLYGEGFFGRSYAIGEALGYQTTSLDLEDSDAPIVAPSLRYNFVGEPNASGAYWGLDLNTLNIRRRDDYIETTNSHINERQSFRFGATPYWTLPYTGVLGDIYNLTLSVQADGYLVDHVDPFSDDTTADGREFSGFTGRVFPKGSFDWRWPLANTTGNLTHIIQPMLQLVGSRDCCDSGKIPNEDSRAFELDETRLFSRDRFPGLDRVDSGSRLTYGLDYTVYGPVGQSAGLFFGQSYQFDQADFQRFNSGIDDDVTDLVGKVFYRFDPYADVTYRFRLDTDDGVDFNRHQISLDAGPEQFRLGASYLFLDEGSADRLDTVRRGSTRTNVEQFVGTLNSKITENWSFNGEFWQDFQNDQTLRWGAGFQYQDECFGLGFTFLHTNSSETIDEESDTTFLFTISFTNLGSIDAPL